MAVGQYWSATIGAWNAILVKKETHAMSSKALACSSLGAQYCPSPSLISIPGSDSWLGGLKHTVDVISPAILVAVLCDRGCN